MKKDRNTFFQSAGMSSQMTMPMQPMMQPQMMQQPMTQPQTMQQAYNQTPMYPAPIQSSQASQSFYSGPSNTFPNQLENIEKAINNLESRVTKLENQLAGSTKDYSTNMYMV